MNLQHDLAKTITRLGYWADYRPIEYGKWYGLFDEENLEFRTCLANGEFGEVVQGIRCYLTNDQHDSDLFAFMWDLLDSHRFCPIISRNLNKRDSDIGWNLHCYNIDDGKWAHFGRYFGATRVEVLAKCFIAVFESLGEWKSEFIEFEWSDAKLRMDND